MKGILLLDWMALVFIGVVILISANIIYYRGSYMRGDKAYERFFYLVFLFVASILLIILSPNFIRILLGWDGLGLVSYCLVIFYQNNKSFNAGIITILRNRVGDIGLLIGIGWIISLGDWNFYLIPFKVENNIRIWVCLCIFIAGLTKSAQIPFSAWLPAAMAAPTPVSALVHSSTLVTAGVYLLIRFYNFIYINHIIIEILFYISFLTCFIAGVGANFECDLKKIIALSTLRQLGLIIGAVSLAAPLFAFCHLLRHALFKALLFMCAGKIIHVIGGSQDIRIIGGLINNIPISAVCFNISNLALCGIPFLSGFYTKDLILEFRIRLNYNFLIFVILFVRTSLTCSYSFRLSWYSIGMDYYFSSFSNREEEDVKYSSSMLVLLTGAIFGGSFFRWILFMTPEESIIRIWWKISPFRMILTGLILGLLINMKLLSEFCEKIRLKISFLSNIWFIPYISRQIIIFYWLYKGNERLEYGDFGWNEEIGGQGMNYYLLNIGVRLQKVQNNSIKLFIFIIISWVVVYFSLLFYLNSLRKAELWRG